MNTTRFKQEIDFACDLTGQEKLPATTDLIIGQGEFGKTCQTFRVTPKQLAELGERFGPLKEEGGIFAERSEDGSYLVRFHSSGSSQRSAPSQPPTIGGEGSVDKPVEQARTCVSFDYRCQSQSALAKQLYLRDSEQANFEICKQLHDETSSQSAAQKSEGTAVLEEECWNERNAFETGIRADTSQYLRDRGLNDGTVRAMSNEMTSYIMGQVFHEKNSEPFSASFDPQNLNLQRAYEEARARLKESYDFMRNDLVNHGKLANQRLPDRALSDDSLVKLHQRMQTHWLKVLGLSI